MVEDTEGWEGLPGWVREERMNLPGLGEVSWSGEEVGCVT